MVVSLLVIAGLAWAASAASASSSPSPSDASCSAASVSAHLTHLVPRDGVVAYGCEGDWAYLWATVAVGSAPPVGVTELMHYANGGWFAASRATYCRAGLLPDVVYRRACFSN